LISSPQRDQQPPALRSSTAVLVTSNPNVRADRPLAQRAGDLLKVITFGSPCRPPGPTLLGNNPPGSGILRIYMPEQFRSRTYDFVLDGDMYSTATDDTLLHLGYEALTPLELDLPFASTAKFRSSSRARREAHSPDH
jgi:hypothetical protein